MTNMRLTKRIKYMNRKMYEQMNIYCTKSNFMVQIIRG